MFPHIRRDYMRFTTHSRRSRDSLEALLDVGNVDVVCLEVGVSSS